jgi:selenocysteine lyase/cysteine desulfurase
VRAVTVDDVLWADLPDRQEGGSPNVIGAVALAAAVTRLAEVGLDRIAAHEQALVGHTMARLAGIPGLRLYGPVGEGAATGKVGVVPFTLDGVDPALVAAVLGYEHGIGVRSGCFCAHPYVAHLMGFDEAEVLRRFESGGAPGAVRISLGAYNDTADIDRAVEALALVAAGAVRATYDRAPDGTWAPRGSSRSVVPDRGIPR